MADSTREQTRKAPRRVGVLGAGGQLGRCLVRQIQSAPDLALAFGLTRAELDLADAPNLGPGIARVLAATGDDAPEVVINAAAYTKVDLCETERALAYQTNALAPGEWARQLAERGIRFIHLSTDYVFPGDGTVPYRESDPTEPRTVYGASKRAGEVAVLGHQRDALVVRTSWVFGPGRNFPLAILDQARKRRAGEAEGPLRVVDDQRGAPTLAEDLAFALLAIARQGASEWGGGLLHLRNGGETTWYGFAREILDQAGFADIAIEPVSSDTFETAARRPAFSVLDCSWAESKGIVMPPWKHALSRYLAGPDCPYERAAPDAEAPTGPPTGPPTGRPAGPPTSRSESIGGGPPHDAGPTSNRDSDPNEVSR